MDTIAETFANTNTNTMTYASTKLRSATDEGEEVAAALSAVRL
jgi:hypothetical protein